MPFRDEVPLPHVPGHEVVGRVIAGEPAGSVRRWGRPLRGVPLWPCGRCPACRRGDEALCAHIEAWVGFTHPGGFQERLVVPLDRLVPLPPRHRRGHGAPMSCALGTAFRAVVTRGQVRAGHRVVVMGWAGVGIHAAQIAACAGARVVGFDVHDPTIAAAGDAGHRARRSEDEAAVAAIMDETAARVSTSCSTPSGDELDAARRRGLVRQGGRIVGVGYSPRPRSTVATTRMVLDELAFIGSRYAIATRWSGRCGWWRPVRFVRSWGCRAASTTSTRCLERSRRATGRRRRGARKWQRRRSAAKPRPGG